jgi:hypothetical protein
MRLNDDQTRSIHDLALEIAGEGARVRLFGSRLDDSSRGGDVDPLLEAPQRIESPAYVAALLSARVSRLFGGRKVDVLIAAPNLARLPIHDVALRDGVLL